MQERMQPIRLGGGSVILGTVVKSHKGFSTATEMVYTSQHCCDKTMDGQMAFYRECCFPNCTKLWWIKLHKVMVNKVTFVGFRGEITPIIPPGLPLRRWGTERRIAQGFRVLKKLFVISLCLKSFLLVKKCINVLCSYSESKTMKCFHF